MAEQSGKPDDDNKADGHQDEKIADTQHRALKMGNASWLAGRDRRFCRNRSSSRSPSRRRSSRLAWRWTPNTPRPRPFCRRGAIFRSTPIGRRLSNRRRPTSDRPGTTLPSLTRTKSPGTSSLASISFHEPSRLTRALSASFCLRSAMALSALNSCQKPTPALMKSIARMMARSAQC